MKIENNIFSNNDNSLVDTNNRTWTCPMCLSRNALPTAYQDTQSELPYSLHPTCTTVEYILPRPAKFPPIFLFVVDICTDDDDNEETGHHQGENLQALKETILVGLSLLPPDALVGIISFGTMVNVYEVGTNDCVKSYSFRGSKEYDLKQIEDILGLTPSSSTNNQFRPPQIQNQIPGINYNASKFLAPVDSCEFQLTNILEEMQHNSWKIDHDKRSLRATGCALNIAISLMQSAYPNSGARIMTFAAGPCTFGPGLVVGDELKEPIRSHHDIDKDRAKHFKKALKYYSNLASRAALNGHAIDIFAGCYDQVGMLEMESLVTDTGGVLVLADSFTTAIFKQSFQRMFSTDPQDGFLSMGLNATLEVVTSKDVKVSGMIGHGVSLNKQDCGNVADTQTGMGFTSAWKLCSITPNSSYSLFFEISPSGTPSHASTDLDQPTGLIQFLTSYQHASGTMRLKVTTIARNLLTSGDGQLALSFDQEAAAVLMTRIAIYKLRTNDTGEVLRWIDRTLVLLCGKFAEYRKDDASSFRLSQNFSLYPQFMFHLRRSQFLQVFNNSPDETAFYRHVFNEEDTTNSLIMIQPTLTAFELDQVDPEPVLLDSVSIKPARILLLDTFFHVLIYHGSTIAEWKRLGYQDQADYVSFKELLEAPRAEVAELLVDRFPLPRFIDTEEGGSQARFLLSKLNPSTTYESFNGPANASSMYGFIGGGSTMGQQGGNRTGEEGSGAIILTDDVSLQKFMEHLIKLVVATQ